MMDLFEIMPIFVIGIKRIAMRSNLIHFDWAMKRLLRDKSNYVVLEGFLSTLLQEDIHICRFLESEPINRMRATSSIGQIFWWRIPKEN